MKKRNWLQRTLVLCVISGLLVLAGCDETAEDSLQTATIDGNWLARESNPFIGTWSYNNNELEFKTDGTIVNKTTIGGVNSESTQYYLIKDNYIVISSLDDPYYTTYQFLATDNKKIKLTVDNNTVDYTRVGAENPKVSRALKLENGLDGYWRCDNLDFGQEEAPDFAYDWYSFKKNGTYHVYNYMNKNKYHDDLGEFSYYIDDESRVVTMNHLYDVTVYYEFTYDEEDNENAFSLKTSDEEDTEPVSFEKFDGSTFWQEP